MIIYPYKNKLETLKRSKKDFIIPDIKNMIFYILPQRTGGKNLVCVTSLVIPYKCCSKDHSKHNYIANYK